VVAWRVKHACKSFDEHLQDTADELQAVGNIPCNNQGILLVLVEGDVLKPFHVLLVFSVKV